MNKDIIQKEIEVCRGIMKSCVMSETFGSPNIPLDLALSIIDRLEDKLKNYE